MRLRTLILEAVGLNETFKMHCRHEESGSVVSDLKYGGTHTVDALYTLVPSPVLCSFFQSPLSTLTPEECRDDNRKSSAYSSAAQAFLGLQP